MMRSRINRLIPTVLLTSVVSLGGCGILTARQDTFPNAETGDDGQSFTLDDLRELVNDPDLTDMERRDAFRDMGIEDADLIQALLTLGP